MRIEGLRAAAAAAASADQGVPVITIDGTQKGASTLAPMRVFMRDIVGRTQGYGSLATALSAARNLSRGAERDALVVERGTNGVYQVHDAVWQYLNGRNQPPSYRAPFRHFAFEDGTFSAYSCVDNGQKIEVEPTGLLRAYDGITRWLVDGSRVLEATPEGGTGA
jgi:hypothetical protein